MNYSLKMVIPEYATDATLINTNVPENDRPAYSGTEIYSIGDEVVYIDINKHWIVRSLVDNNQGNIPTGLATDTNWVRVSETNRWKMFDQKTTSQTVLNGSISVTVGGVSTADSAAILNVDANSISLTVRDNNSNVIYTADESMVDNGNVVDWYSYWFAPIQRKKDIVFVDIPPYAQTTYELTVDNGSGDAKCGTFIVGKRADIAVTRHDSKVSVQDYSIKESDEFGDFVITERPYSKRADIVAYLDKRVTDYVANILTQYRATPVLYIGTDEYTSTYIYGFYKDWEINFSFPNHNELTMELLGLS